MALGEGIRQLLHELGIAIRTERHLLTHFVQQQYLGPGIAGHRLYDGGENCGSA